MGTLPVPSETQVVEKYRRLAVWQACRFSRRYGVDYLAEDLQQEAQIGLLRAIRTYDPSYGYEFESYLYWKVDAALRDAYRTWDNLTRRHRKKVKAGEVEEPKRVSAPHLVDTSLVSNPFRCALVAEIKRSLASQPQRDRIIVMAWASGFTRTEIAQMVGVSLSRINQLLARAFCCVREDLLGKRGRA